VKRLVRESFRIHQQALEGLDVVVMAQKETLLKSASDLKTSINKHWGEIIKCAVS
jgi:ribonuclease P protein component